MRRDLQKIVIDDFYKSNEFPTYDEMTRLTGIERSRMFRIRNGHKITANELLVLSDASKSEFNLSLFLDCSEELPREIKDNLAREMVRALAVKRLSNSRRGHE